MESLTGYGLVPELPSERFKYVGNTSKTGARMALLSKTAREDVEILARETNYIELAEVENYDRLFAKCMEFPVLDTFSGNRV